MNGAGGKKFCEQCKTHVNNLEERSHEEILDLIQKSNNHLCGYFYDDQLKPEPEQKSSFHPKLIMASVAAWLTFNAPKASAQQVDTVITTTEQYDSVAVDTSNHRYGVVDKNPVCFLDVEQPVVTPRKYRRHTITLFHVFGKRVFLSKRFPFIHARAMRMGYIRTRW